MDEICRLRCVETRVASSENLAGILAERQTAHGFFSQSTKFNFPVDHVLDVTPCAEGSLGSRPPLGHVWERVVQSIDVLSRPRLPPREPRGGLPAPRQAEHGAQLR
jgi:hypothetical protein